MHTFQTIKTEREQNAYFERLHELVELRWWQEVANVVLAGRHLGQLCRPLFSHTPKQDSIMCLDEDE